CKSSGIQVIGPVAEGFALYPPLEGEGRRRANASRRGGVNLRTPTRLAALQLADLPLQGRWEHAARCWLRSENRRYYRFGNTRGERDALALLSPAGAAQETAAARMVRVEPDDGPRARCGGAPGQESRPRARHPVPRRLQQGRQDHLHRPPHAADF